MSNIAEQGEKQRHLQQIECFYKRHVSSVKSCANKVIEYLKCQTYTHDDKNLLKHMEREKESMGQTEKRNEKCVPRGCVMLQTVTQRKTKESKHADGWR